MARTVVVDVKMILRGTTNGGAEDVFNGGIGMNKGVHSTGGDEEDDDDDGDGHRFGKDDGEMKNDDEECKDGDEEEGQENKFNHNDAPDSGDRSLGQRFRQKKDVDVDP